MEHANEYYKKIELASIKYNHENDLLMKINAVYTDNQLTGDEKEEIINSAIDYIATLRKTN